MITKMTVIIIILIIKVEEYACTLIIKLLQSNENLSIDWSKND